MRSLRTLVYPFMFLTFVLLAFFTNPANTTENTEKPTTTACQEPRPEICTMDYRPVCAKLNDGSFKTYANGCNACSDPNVISYINKACKAKEDH